MPEPLQVEVSGRAPLVRALNDASLDSLDKGERIAFPILVVLLLLVFRSPIAALIPLACGLLVTRIGMALMGALNEAFQLDALALNMLTMIGLALGVDYSLLIVSRFREELAAGRDVESAVEQAVMRAGRTVVFAGTALAVGMLGALFIAPGALLESATLGVVVACVLAVITALFAIPAGLAALGTNVNRWQLWSSTGQNPWVRLSERVSRKPMAAVLLTTFPLLLLSAPALALDTGPPNVENLPPDNASRKSFEAFQRDRGAGWATPFEVDFQTEGPITTEAAAAAAEAVPERRRPAARDRGRPGPGIAARAHRGVAQADEADRVGRPPAGASGERPRAAAGGDRALEQRPRAGRRRRRGAERGPGAGSRRLGPDRARGPVPRCPRPRSSPTASPGRARAPSASALPRGGPARARASSTTRSTSWHG